MRAASATFETAATSPLGDDGGRAVQTRHHLRRARTHDHHRDRRVARHAANVEAHCTQGEPSAREVERLDERWRHAAREGALLGHEAQLRARFVRLERPALAAAGAPRAEPVNRDKRRARLQLEALRADVGRVRKWH